MKEKRFKEVCMALARRDSFYPDIPSERWNRGLVEYFTEHGNSMYWFPQLPKKLQTRKLAEKVLKEKPQYFHYLRMEFITPEMSRLLCQKDQDNIRHFKERVMEFQKYTGLPAEFYGCETATPINAALVENYYNQIKTISDNCHIPVPEDWFATLLRMPDVLTRVDIQELSDEEWEVASKAIEEALQHLVDFRKQEGAALEKKFTEKVDNIERLLKSIEPFEKERVAKIRERITEALEKTISVDYDKNRLEQELIYYIEKLDINEEKQRLANHLKYFRETMAGGHGQGKKLGFIAQEMGREINTTGSKSNHAEMQNIVVQMKDELEQIKEQVLNVM